MPSLPRLAVGTIQPGADRCRVLWALNDVLRRQGCQWRLFRSQACFSPLDALRHAVGHAPRHLDSWLMSADLCREIFAHGAQGTDLAVIEGDYLARQDKGGCLETLCQWLDVPRVAIVDVSRISDCQLPTRPVGVEGLLLDRLSSADEYYRWSTTLTALWNIPVFGGLVADTAILAPSLTSTGDPSTVFCRALGDALQPTFAWPEFERLAQSRRGSAAEPRTFAAQHPSAPLRVAMALDDAFHCYFPDALDLLELAGAELIDFSPLRDERLPADTDLVYLGCGHPERFGEALSGNHCMAAALREHVCQGKRVYAEAGGAAYLCQHVVTPGGTIYPMAGVFPAVALAGRGPMQPEPRELTIPRGCWLARAGAPLRGYVNRYWEFEPTTAGAEPCCQSVAVPDFLCRGRALGSRVHLNFAALPELLERILAPLDVPATQAV